MGHDSMNLRNERTQTISNERMNGRSCVRNSIFTKLDFIESSKIKKSRVLLRSKTADRRPTRHNI